MCVTHNQSSANVRYYYIIITGVLSLYRISRLLVAFMASKYNVVRAREMVKSA